jgi:hypothetical protein
MELFDGLMLGDGGLRLRGHLKTPTFMLSQSERHLDWIDQVERELWIVGLTCARQALQAGPGGRGPAVELRTLAYEEFLEQHARWYVPREGRGPGRWRKIVPPDVRLTPLALAQWYYGDGSLGNGGYSIRFATHGFKKEESEFLLARLRELYGWQGVVYRDAQRGREYWAIRFSRSEDRNALVELVRPWTPNCFLYKLRVKVSAPCSSEEEARRRKPLRHTEAQAAEVRRRALAGEPYEAVAKDLGMTALYVGRIARGERWKSGEPILRRAPARKLTRAEFEDVLTSLLKGESQNSIGRRHGIAQPRIAWIKKRYLSALIPTGS